MFYNYKFFLGDLQITGTRNNIWLANINGGGCRHTTLRLYFTLSPYQKPSVSPNLLQYSYLGSLTLISEILLSFSGLEGRREGYTPILLFHCTYIRLVFLPVVDLGLNNGGTRTYRIGGLDTLYRQQIRWVRCHKTISSNTTCRWSTCVDMMGYYGTLILNFILLIILYDWDYGIRTETRISFLLLCFTTLQKTEKINVLYQ